MTAMTPLPHDHPMLMAWNKYKETAEFANTKHWVSLPNNSHNKGLYIDCSLWASFMAGWNAAQDAASHAAVPALLDEVERLKKLATRLLKGMSWCEVCGKEMEQEEQHD